MASVFVSTSAEVVLIDSRTRQGTITLPLTNSIPYRTLNFKDQYGSFSNSTFTLSTQVGETFDDGTTSKVLSNAYGFFSLYAVSSKWMVLNGTQTVSQTISSLNVDQLNFGTGAGWVQFGPVQASIVSTIQVNTNDAYLNNVYVGTQSTINDIAFYGLFGNYNNTVLAEISTGGGSQELLVFKGSSASDRVRVQTTGNFVVETGVSARLFSTTTQNTLSNATPAFIINTSSNVGIQTASPGATLDVAGTGRFQSLSSLTLFVSSINGALPGSGGGDLTQANLTSTIVGLGTLGYISTPTGGGGGGAIDFVSAFTVSTGLLEASSISSYGIFAYGIVASQLFNQGPEPLAITTIPSGTLNSFSNWTFSSAYSTIMDGNALYLNASNSVRIVAPSNLYLNTPQVITNGSIKTSDVIVSSVSFVDGNTGLSNPLFVSSGLLLFNNSTLNGLYPSEYVCQGRLTSNESITANTDTVVPFVSDFDPQGWLANAGTSTARFQPTIAGYYIISYQVWWDRGAGADQDNIQIRKSGNTIAINQNAIPTVTGLSMNATKIAYLNGTTDYLDFSVYSSTSDPTQTVQYGGTPDGPGTFFSASLVSGGAGGGGGGGVSQIVAGSNVTIDPVGGIGVVTINATGGGGGGGPVDVLSSPVKIGSGPDLSQIAFYGLAGTFSTSVIAQASTGPGTGEIVIFQGSSINDQIRLTTTGNIVFEPQVAQTDFSNIAPLAVPTMILQSNLVGIATATPGAPLDVAGTGRFVTASSVSMYTGAFYGGVFFL
jgi:hypothetical protein